MIGPETFAGADQPGLGCSVHTELIEDVKRRVVLRDKGA